MHRENDMLSEISKLNCLQRSLSRHEVHKVIKVAGDNGLGPRDQDRIFSVGREFLSKG